MIPCCNLVSRNQYCCFSSFLEKQQYWFLETRLQHGIIVLYYIFQTAYYTGLDHLAQDINLVFENAKRYNADESIIYRVSGSIFKINCDFGVSRHLVVH